MATASSSILLAAAACCPSMVERLELLPVIVNKTVVVVGCGEP
jgi:hypothetical protein